MLLPLLLVVIALPDPPLLPMETPQLLQVKLSAISVLKDTLTLLLLPTLELL